MQLKAPWMLKAPGWVTIMLCNNGKPSGPPSHPSHALGRVECGVIGHAQYSSAVVNQLDFMWTLKARPSKTPTIPFPDALACMNTPTRHRSLVTILGITLAMTATQNAVHISAINSFAPTCRVEHREMRCAALICPILLE
ncbi:hypothetical protein HBI32_080560 [Parastagonospora nodorum]|nr:hypothetical protein HBI32_080560 [Parastagonospora nodorum]